ncbi:hypothetical protein BDV93DRAFT_564292 [Ceratobasidium sp. AG-I]|nr:hypothetical protein BDV93DRAFT_564292 [Ceratobasidium sp. AG-I]
MSNIMRIPDTPPPGWHSVRPWVPRLSLYVHEITSVSVTFILSCRFNAPGLPESAALEEELGGKFEESEVKHKISDALGKGLAVKVNGSPWQRVVMHVDEESDEEAVLILYGLMPAKHYEIELSVVAGESIKGNLTTEDELNEFDEPTPAVTQLTTTQTVTPEDTPPDSPTTASSSPPPRQPTVEERASQLRHMQSLLTQEHDQLTAQLKTARRDAQRADAALRLEIEALKKAVEKNAAGEQRAKQKILALQEAVKQALAGAVEADNTVKEMERALPELEARRAEAEEEHARASEDAQRSSSETKAALEADRKRTAEVEGELAVLTSRLEKMSAKRDKMAGETVPELEKELAALHVAIEEAEREKDREKEREFNHEVDYPHHYSQPLPPLRPTPIQRPVHAEQNANSSPGSINAAAPPFVPRNIVGHSRGAGSVPVMGRPNPPSSGIGASKPHNHTASEGFLRGYALLGQAIDLASQRTNATQPTQGAESTRVVGPTGTTSRKGSLPPGSERTPWGNVVPTA